MILEFIDHFVSRYLGNLCGYLNADAIKKAIGVNFMYILLSFWIIWMVCSIFLFRPLSIGGPGEIIGTIAKTGIKHVKEYGDPVKQEQRKERRAANAEKRKDIRAQRSHERQVKRDSGGRQMQQRSRASWGT